MLKKIIKNIYNDGGLPIIFLNAKYEKSDTNWVEYSLLPKSTNYFSTDLLVVKNYYKNISTDIDNNMFESISINEKKI